MSIGVWKDSFVYDLSVVIVSSFLILFGVPGNCLILRVYWTKTRKTNTHILVMALAAADLAVCILRFVFLTEKVLALAGDSRQKNNQLRTVSAKTTKTSPNGGKINVLLVKTISSADGEALGYKSPKGPVEQSCSTLQDSSVFDLSAIIANSIVFVFGVPGNCLVLRVSLTKTRKTSTHALIMALAWADLTLGFLRIVQADLTVCSLRIIPVAEKALALANKFNENDLVFRAIAAVGHVAIAFSGLITMVIALDRYDCICRPQKRFFITLKSSEVAAIVTLLTSLLIAIPKFIRITNRLNPVAYQAQVSLYIVSLLTMFAVIVVAYGKIYAIIRKHVTIGVDEMPKDGDEYNSAVVDKSTLKVINTGQDRGNFDTANVDKPVSVSTDIHRHDSAASDQAGISQTKQTLVDINNTDTASSSVVCNSLRKEARIDIKRKTHTPKKAEQAIFKDTRSSSRSDDGTHQVPKRPGGVLLQRKTTRMLFITSLVLILTWLSFFTHYGLTFALHAGADINAVYLETSYVLALALYINNAINPLVYGLAIGRFRQDFKKELCRIRYCLA
ncbi:alpha-2Da adrenergic receptor-like [Acanthaster planci]|uniref:Alpha-2Da adrenergic receptor-like n=1 Tax=Acanthaster planci TaxID=133434 RepID=A0A8B7Z3R6_ACAPL|nr:alpha-2Da adrenergic receptor-like [Acanthaster planci]